MDYPIEYKGFKITVNKYTNIYDLFDWEIRDSDGDIFDASPVMFGDEKEAIEDAKEVIDKYNEEA